MLTWLPSQNPVAQKKVESIKPCHEVFFLISRGQIRLLRKQKTL